MSSWPLSLIRPRVTISGCDSILPVCLSIAMIGTTIPSSERCFRSRITTSSISSSEPESTQTRPAVTGSRRNTPSSVNSICWPSSTSCPNTVWQPVTAGVATEAATHLHGTVTYSSQQNVGYSDFWLQVASSTASGTFMYYCGVSTNTVDCYPPVLLEPDGSKTLSNYSGGQIDAGSRNRSPASEQADIQWTLTYPQ